MHQWARPLLCDLPMGRSASSWELASPLIACSQPVTPAAKGFFCLALFAEWEVVEAESVVSTQKK